MIFDRWKKELSEITKGKKRRKFDFGEQVGILVFQEWYPYIREGHESYLSTYDFPIRLKFVKNYLSTKKGELFNTSKFIEKARELEQEGVRAIVSGCGITALIQKKLSNSVNVPVFTSTLLFVPLISKTLKKEEKVGILTISSEMLFAQNKKILRNCGISEEVPIVIKGMRESSYSKAWYSQWNEGFDEEKVEEAIVKAAEEMVFQNSGIGAIVLECTEMPPFSESIRETTGVPVFDSVDMVKFVHNTIR